MKIFLKILHFLIVIICIVLQLAFFGNFSIFGINIDLILVVIAGIAIFDDVILAIIYGFFAGIVLDLLTGDIIGISALIYAVNGFIAGNFIRLTPGKKIVNHLLLIFLITEINLFLLSGIYYLFSFELSLKRLGLELILNPVFNIMAMFLIFPILRAGRQGKEEIGFIYKDKI